MQRYAALIGSAQNDASTQANIPASPSCGASTQTETETAAETATEKGVEKERLQLQQLQEQGHTLATERASHAQSQAHLATVEQHWQARLEAAEAAGREAEQSARQDADDIAELREAQQSHDALGQDAQAQERAATAAAVAKLERALELVEELRGSLEELSAKNARLEEAGLERQRQRSLEDREAVDSERRRDEHMQRVAAEALQPVAELHAELDSLRRERDELTLACR